MANEKAVSIDQLSHFKAKQDLENLNKFKLKSDSTDLMGAVRYDAAQALTPEQKAQARANIGVNENGSSGGGSVEGAVRHDVEQALDEDDKARARQNIGTTDGTWENMPDKPFGDTGFKIEWDGDTTDKESFPIPNAEILSLVNVSSQILTEEELLGATLKFYWDSNDLEEEISQDGTFTIAKTDNGNLIVLFNGQLPVVFVATDTNEDSFNGVALAVNRTGLWFFKGSFEQEYVRYIQKNHSIRKIDKEFLPDSVVTTDENGLIPASVLPSYVDDVVEGYYNGSNTFFEQYYEENGGYGVQITPESGKIYLDLLTGDTYRWSGSVYVQLNPPEITFATDADINALFA